MIEKLIILGSISFYDIKNIALSWRTQECSYLNFLKYVLFVALIQRVSQLNLNQKQIYCMNVLHLCYIILDKIAYCENNN